MSIGQKITLIRKNKNLSQEAFGEALGVTRQAISKWESEQSVPDVDNLILISKRFDVSVGWLLGIEDEEQKDNADISDINSVLEDYLVKISEMSERHVPVKDINAEKKEQSRKLISIISWILIGCMLIWNVSLSGRLADTDSRLEALNDNLVSYKNEAMGVMDRLKSDIEASKGTNSHISEFSYNYIEYYPEENEVKLMVSFIPQNITKDSRVTVTVSTEYGPYPDNDYAVYAEYNESSCRYFATLTVPVMKGMRVNLTVDDGEKVMGSEICKLDVYEQVSPTKTGIEYKNNNDSAVELKDGKIIKGDFDFYTAAPAFENTFLGHKIKTVKTELMVYHNGKFVKSAEMQDNYGKQMQVGINLAEFLGELTFVEDDSLYFEVKMTDNYGREYTSDEAVSMLVRGDVMVSYYNAPGDEVYDYSYSKQW